MSESDSASVPGWEARLPRVPALGLGEWRLLEGVKAVPWLEPWPHSLGSLSGDNEEAASFSLAW